MPVAGPEGREQQRSLSAWPDLHRPPEIPGRVPCPGCRYDLRGVAGRRGAVCPECGRTYTYDRLLYAIGRRSSRGAWAFVGVLFVVGLLLSLSATRIRHGIAISRDDVWTVTWYLVVVGIAYVISPWRFGWPHTPRWVFAIGTGVLFYVPMGGQYGANIFAILVWAALWQVTALARPLRFDW